MISIRKILLVASLVLILIATDTQHSWAVSVSVQQPVIMNLFGNAKAKAEDLKGKAQESLGETTDYEKERATSKNNQGQSIMGKAVKNVQDKTDSIADNVKAKAKEIETSTRKGADEIKAKV